MVLESSKEASDRSRLGPQPHFRLPFQVLEKCRFLQDPATGSQKKGASGFRERHRSTFLVCRSEATLLQRVCEACGHLTKP